MHKLVTKLVSGERQPGDDSSSDEEEEEEEKEEEVQEEQPRNNARDISETVESQTEPQQLHSDDVSLPKQTTVERSHGSSPSFDKRTHKSSNHAIREQSTKSNNTSSRSSDGRSSHKSRDSHRSNSSSSSSKAKRKYDPKHVAKSDESSSEDSAATTDDEVEIADSRGKSSSKSSKSLKKSHSTGSSSGRSSSHHKSHDKPPRHSGSGSNRESSNKTHQGSKSKSGSSRFLLSEEEQRNTSPSAVRVSSNQQDNNLIDATKGLSLKPNDKKRKRLSTSSGARGDEAHEHDPNFPDLDGHPREDSLLHDVDEALTYIRRTASDEDEEWDNESQNERDNVAWATISKRLSPNKASGKKRTRARKDADPAKVAAKLAEIEAVRSKRVEKELEMKKGRDEQVFQRRVLEANSRSSVVDGDRKRRVTSGLGASFEGFYGDNLAINKCSRTDCDLISGCANMILGDETGEANNSAEDNVLIDSFRKSSGAAADAVLKDNLMKHLQVEIFKEITFERLVTEYAVAKREACGAGDDEIVDIDWFDVFHEFRLVLKARLNLNSKFILIRIHNAIDNDVRVEQKHAAKEVYTVSMAAFIKHGNRTINSVINKTIHKIGAHFDSVNFSEVVPKFGTYATKTKGYAFAFTASLYNMLGTEEAPSTASGDLFGIDPLLSEIMKTNNQDVHVNDIIQYRLVKKSMYIESPENYGALHKYLEKKTKKDVVAAPSLDVIALSKTAALSPSGVEEVMNASDMSFEGSGMNDTSMEMDSTDDAQQLDPEGRSASSLNKQLFPPNSGSPIDLTSQSQNNAHERSSANSASSIQHSPVMVLDGADLSPLATPSPPLSCLTTSIGLHWKQTREAKVQLAIRVIISMKLFFSAKNREQVTYKDFFVEYFNYWLEKHKSLLYRYRTPRKLKIDLTAPKGTKVLDEDEWQTHVDHMENVYRFYDLGPYIIPDDYLGLTPEEINNQYYQAALPECLKIINNNNDIALRRECNWYRMFIRCIHHNEYARNLIEGHIPLKTGDSEFSLKLGESIFGQNINIHQAMAGVDLEDKDYLSLNPDLDMAEIEAMTTFACQMATSVYAKKSEDQEVDLSAALSTRELSTRIGKGKRKNSEGVYSDDDDVEDVDDDDVEDVDGDDNNAVKKKATCTGGSSSGTKRRKTNRVKTLAGGGKINAKSSSDTEKQKWFAFRPEQHKYITEAFSKLCEEVQTTTSSSAEIDNVSPFPCPRDAELVKLLQLSRMHAPSMLLRGLNEVDYTPISLLVCEKVVVGHEWLMSGVIAHIPYVDRVYPDSSHQFPVTPDFTLLHHHSEGEPMLCVTNPFFHGVLVDESSVEAIVEIDGPIARCIREPEVGQLVNYTFKEFETDVTKREFALRLVACVISFLFPDSDLVDHKIYGIQPGQRVKSTVLRDIEYPLNVFLFESVKNRFALCANYGGALQFQDALADRLNWNDHAEVVYIPGSLVLGVFKCLGSDAEYLWPIPADLHDVAEINVTPTDELDNGAGAADDHGDNVAAVADDYEVVVDDYDGAAANDAEGVAPSVATDSATCLSISRQFPEAQAKEWKSDIDKLDETLNGIVGVESMQVRLGQIVVELCDTLSQWSNRVRLMHNVIASAADHHESTSWKQYESERSQVFYYYERYGWLCPSFLVALRSPSNLSFDGDMADYGEFIGTLSAHGSKPSLEELVTALSNNFAINAEQPAKKGSNAKNKTVVATPIRVSRRNR
eukprot:gene24139-30451_t